MTSLHLTDFKNEVAKELCRKDPLRIRILTTSSNDKITISFNEMVELSLWVDDDSQLMASFIITPRLESQSFNARKATIDKAYKLFEEAIVTTILRAFSIKVGMQYR